MILKVGISPNLVSNSSNSPGGLLESTPVVLIDTLHLFPESYQHVNNVTKHYPKMILGLMGLS